MYRFHLESLICDGCHSITRTKRGKLWEELVQMRDGLKAAERYGDGDLDLSAEISMIPVALT